MVKHSLTGYNNIESKVLPTNWRQKVTFLRMVNDAVCPGKYTVTFVDEIFREM